MSVYVYETTCDSETYTKLNSSSQSTEHDCAGFPDKAKKVSAVYKKKGTEEIVLFSVLTFFVHHDFPIFSHCGYSLMGHLILQLTSLHFMQAVQMREI